MSAQLIDVTQLVAEPQPVESNKPTGDGYPYKGKLLPRVTNILGIAPGQHLLSWYAKQGCLETAQWLLVAGVFQPDPDRENAEAVKVAEELIQFVDGKAKRLVSAEEAFANIANWADNMRAPERHRDAKARIGQVAHHAFYDRAIKETVPCKPEDTLTYLQGHAKKVLANREYASFTARMIEIGKTEDELTTDLAYGALPYVVRLWEWVETYKPRFRAIGLEAMVVNEDEDYAGTEDMEATLDRSAWLAADEQPWPFPGLSEATVVGDVKTSKSLDLKVPFQLAAYDRAERVVLASGEEFDKEPCDGLLALHARPDKRVIMKAWTAEQAETFFDGFCGLNVFYRVLNDMPKSARTRREAKPKVPKKTEVVECDF